VASRLRRIPFVFEVADLWPENLIAVGENPKGRAVRVLASTERLLLSRAAKVVTVTEGFREFYLARGVEPKRVAVVTNGVDLVRFQPQPVPSNLAESLGVAGKFVAAYIGTVGINHGLLTVLAAAERLKDRPEIVFLIVGDGAERAWLEADAHRRGLTNVQFLGERPTSEMPQYHALADVLLVLLRDSDYFHRVIPSKIFVAMAMAKPVVLGVRGEAARIVEAAGCGLCVPPENPEALADAVSRAAGLRASGELVEFGRRGREHVERHYDRNAKAIAYLALLTEVVASR
jgi:glycosyltransferase involved in cell wall biosynthesis